MSLLLDARKKSQESSASAPKLELSLEAAPARNDSAQKSARSASQNLFQAKAATPSGGHVNRNLLYVLLGSIALFALGAVYVWYEINSMSRPVAHPAAQPTPAPPALLERVPAPVEKIATPPTDALVPEIAPVAQQSAPVLPAITPRVTKPSTPKPIHNLTPAPQRNGHTLNITRDPSDDLNAQLNSAYLAYQAGRYEQAQQLYHGVLMQETRNIDALLGLAAIAQHAGADAQAQQYYARVLTLDPRNAVANAGILALSPDDNRESRLKMLLNEQKDSSSLHFALANLYAGQQRWAEAQQAYFTAYQLDSNNATLAFNLAISLERLGQNKLAAQYYRRAIELDQSNAAGFDHNVIAQHAQKLAQ